MPGQRNTGLSGVSGIVITDDLLGPGPIVKDDRIPRFLGSKGVTNPALVLTDDLGAVLQDDLGISLEADA